MNSILDLLSLGAILSSVLVITSKNPVVAVIFLISLFINTAGYLILLGIGFVGISYIIIYVGGITVLFLFVIMMVNIRLSEILELGSQYTKNLPLAFIVGSLFIYEIFSIIPFSINNIAILNLPFAAGLDVLSLVNDFLLNSSTPLSSLGSFSNISAPVFSQNYTSLALDTAPAILSDFIINDFTQIAVLGQGLYSYGALLLLLVSFILLLSMVAAIIISSSSHAAPESFDE